MYKKDHAFTSRLQENGIEELFEKRINVIFDGFNIEDISLVPKGFSNITKHSLKKKLVLQHI